MIYEDLGPIAGMNRRNDGRTSVLAAHKVRRRTLRQTVVGYAVTAGSYGFTDDQLKAAYPQTPESSMRKRRTELTQENVILDTGRKRLNRHGGQEIVWVHRDWHHAPPPLVERDTTPKQSKLARVKARESALEGALRGCLNVMIEGRDGCIRDDDPEWWARFYSAITKSEELLSH